MPPPSPVLPVSAIADTQKDSSLEAFGRSSCCSSQATPLGTTSTLMNSSAISSERHNINTTSFDRSPTPDPFHAHEYPVFTPLKSYAESNIDSTASKLSEDSLEALRDAEEDWLSPLVLDDAALTHALDMETLQHTLHQSGQRAMSASAARLARVNKQKLPADAAAASVTLINRPKVESRPVHITSIHPNRAPMVAQKHKPRVRSAEFSRNGSNPDWSCSNPPSHSSLYARKPLPQVLSDIKASKLRRNSSYKLSSTPAPTQHTHPSHLHDHHAQFPASSASPHLHPELHGNDPASPLINRNTASSSRGGSSDHGCMQTCDKCLPGSRMTVVPLMDSCDYTDVPPKERNFRDPAPNAKHNKVTNHPIVLWFMSKKKPAKGSMMKGLRNQGAGGKVQAAHSVMMEKDRENIACVKEKIMSLEEGKESLEIAVKSMKQEVAQANEKRDAALVEVFELKVAIEEMGKKLENLEGYCQTMQNTRRPAHPFKNDMNHVAMPMVAPAYASHIHEFEQADGRRDALALGNTQYIGPSKKEFYHAVTEARVSVKQFCRTLLQQIQEQSATSEKIESILQPYNVKMVAPRVSKSVRYHLESLINEAFYEDFENIKFQKSGTNCVLDPRQRPQAFYKTYVGMSQMGWSELVSKESTSYSQSFDAFCDHKMNRVEQVLNWEGRWPDDLARSFFVAAKWVWLLHLLAFSFHHQALIFRVGSEAHFDCEYMEELSLEQGVSSKAKPSTTNDVACASSLNVKAMVMPGFFFNNYEIIKCKVLLSR